MIKKLISAVLVLSIAVIFFSASVKASYATNSPSWHWVTQEISPNVYLDIPVDDRCDNASPAFRVTVFEGHNQTGARARLCGYWDDLSQLPQYKGANAPTFNNSISSIWIKELAANDMIEFHMLKDQTGTAYGFGGEYKFEIDGGFDNGFSSVKKF